MLHRLYADIESLLGLGLKPSVWVLAQLTGWSLAALLSYLDAVVATHVWHPSLTYYLMVVLLLADFLTGAGLAWRHNAFETRKALRVVWKLVSYTFLLAMAHNLGRAERLFGWLPEAVLVPIILLLLMSLLKNLSLLGWIEPRLAAWLYRKVDVYKNTLPPAPPHATTPPDMPTNGPDAPTAGQLP
jgi:phage-related holin